MIRYIYVDGACSGNPGPGGWAAVFSRDDETEDFHISGSEPQTTNSRMELEAVRQALAHTDEGDIIRIYSDSAYVVNCFIHKWYEKWRARGWRTGSGKPIAHRDLWEEILRLVETRQVEFVKVAGHSDVHLNELADKYAKEAVAKQN